MNTKSKHGCNMKDTHELYYSFWDKCNLHVIDTDLFKCHDSQVFCLKQKITSKICCVSCNPSGIFL